MLFPVPPAYPVTSGDEADALQMKAVPAVADEKLTRKGSPEHTDAGCGLTIVTGLGLMVAVYGTGIPKHPLEAGVTV